MASEDSFVKLSSKLVIDWKVTKINPVLAAAKAGEERSLKTSYRDETDGWDLKLHLKNGDAEDGHAGLYLSPRPTREDRDEATAKRDWVRGGKYNVSFEFLSSNGLTTLSAARSMKDKVFGTEGGWGYKDAISWAVLESPAVASVNALLVRCTIEGRALKPPQRSFSPTSFKVLYDDPDLADVVFKLQNSPREPPKYLFGLKRVLEARCAYLRNLLLSGFDESRGRVDLDLHSLHTNPTTPFRGDINEFAAFDNLLPDYMTDESSHARRRTRSQAPYEKDERSDRRPRRLSETIAPSHLAAAPLLPTAGSPEHRPTSVEADSAELSAAEAAGSSEPVSKKQKTGDAEKEAEQEKGKGKGPFATFDAFLFYFYTGRTSFLPSACDYLVAYNDDDFTRYRLARTAWLEGGKSPSDHTLTVQNVAYEAFCLLSVDFEDFQKPVLEFLLEHWDEVKSTTAMQQVLSLLADGSLPDGAVILGKIHAGLTKAPKTAVGDQNKA
ncbi:hypothetical protein JCM8097_001482 [Rhodosporidiobolus ruineniae]